MKDSFGLNFTGERAGGIAPITSRIRWSMNQAVFWVTPRVRLISQELMPFLQIRHEPNANEPLVESNGRILEDRTDLTENWRFA